MSNNRLRNATKRAIGKSNGMDRRGFMKTLGEISLTGVLSSFTPGSVLARVRAPGSETSQANQSTVSTQTLPHAEYHLLSQDWAFHEGPTPGAQRTGFNDNAWQRVVVPHDWSIKDQPDGSPPFVKAPPYRATPGGPSSGYLPGGSGWYRRHLTLNAKAAAGMVLLRFGAIYMDADIWVNGAHVATHHYGYTAFNVDLTGKVHAGDNVVAVRVNHEDPSSRWYAGSGIIRPVYLSLLNQCHIDPNGPTITTPVATAGQGKVAVRTPLRNRSEHAATVVLATRVVDPSGRTVHSATSRQRLKAGASAPIDQRMMVKTPALWSDETPNLYWLVQEMHVGGKMVDRRETRFGIRSVSVDANRGFLLNGKRVLLRGGCIHSANYMLGAAGFPRADERKVELMKAAGYNAIRSAHNPPSQATLEAADRLGMLVIDEAFDAWAKPKVPTDYARFFYSDWRQDIASMIAGGRNHPSVIMWSIGNEIPEQDTPAGALEAHRLAAHVRALDPTRPVAEAINVHGPKVAPLIAELDVAGYNYQPEFYGPDHKTYPKRVMFGSESSPAKAFDYWRPVETMPWVIGDFVWSAVDYLGEASIGWTGYSSEWGKLGPYPWHLAYCGEIDATGRRRPASYYREIVWKTGQHPIAAFVHWPGKGGSLPERDIYPGHPHRWRLPDVHPSWSWRGHEGKPLSVVIYSELPEVELFLNGNSLGRKPVGVANKYQVDFSVPYQPGTLKAVGYRNGKSVSEWVLETVEKPAAIKLSVDRNRITADGIDLAYVIASLVDSSGRPIYARDDDRPLSFKVSGTGALAGVGNGNPMGTESFTSGNHTTFYGRAVAVVRSGTKAGPITVNVSAHGLPTQTVRIESRST